VVAILWTLGHNLAYAVFMPQPGSAGRYVPMNHVFFWTSLVFLALWVKNQALKFMIGTLVITILGTSLGYWHQVYHMNIAYMQDVRMPATRYVEDNCPLDTPVGSTDLGPLRYHIQQPVLDLIGYVNKDIVPVWQNGGSIEDYILVQGISCLSVFMPVDGVGVDTVKVMGLAPDSRYDLRLERTFGVTTDDWLVGSSPVSNYMPAIAIYRIKRLE